MHTNGICLRAEKLGRDLESSELRAVLNISGTSCYSPSAMSLFRAWTSFSPSTGNWFFAASSSNLYPTRQASYL